MVNNSATRYEVYEQPRLYFSAFLLRETNRPEHSAYAKLK